MPNFMLMARDVKRLMYEDSEQFVFPVNGLNGVESVACSFRYVSFMSRERFVDEYVLDLSGKSLLKTNTVAIVDVGEYRALHKGALHLVAVNVLREFIGAMHAVCALIDIKKEGRVVISNSNVHEIEEGFVDFLTIFKDKNCEHFRKNVDIDMNMDTFLSYKNVHFWIDFLNRDISGRNEIGTKVNKLLELSYYSSSSIHAYRRMNDWFIGLNYFFRDGKDINRNFITQKLSVIFDHILKNKCFENKFSKGFEDLYQRVRNDIMHGSLPEYDLSSVDVKDYYALKTIFNYLICFTIEKNVAVSYKTTADLNSYLTSYRPKKD